jgi:hypothetical protein
VSFLLRCPGERSVLRKNRRNWDTTRRTRFMPNERKTAVTLLADECQSIAVGLASRARFFRDLSRSCPAVDERVALVPLTSGSNTRRREENLHRLSNFRRFFRNRESYTDTSAW